MPFGVTGDFQKKRRLDHGGFNCPSGHTNYYPQKTEEDRLKEEVARLQTDQEHAGARIIDLRNQRDKALHQRDGMKGAYCKVAVRVKNGVCPCCNRTFKCLADHIAQKHPEFTSTPIAQ